MEISAQIILFVAGCFAALSQVNFFMVNSYTLPTSECKSQADCEEGECCVLGMIHYSMAQCMPLGRVEDYCRDNTPENRTLFFPNGEQVEALEIYTHVCPCDESLNCTDNFCAQDDDSYENNYLY